MILGIHAGLLGAGRGSAPLAAASARTVWSPRSSTAGRHGGWGPPRGRSASARALSHRDARV